VQFDDIRRTVHPDVALRLEVLHAQFVDGATGEATPTEFAAWLRAQGFLSSAGFRELHVRTEVELTGVHTFVGTKLHEQEPVRKKNWTTSGEHSLQGVLAAGAMGEILIAHDQDLKRTVALKRMKASISADSVLADRFLNEAQITAQLDHPNIVPVYALRSGEGGLSYTMKLVDGRTFKEVLQGVRDAHDRGERAADTDGLRSRVEWFIKVCEAIAYAHSRGVLHRDLKPENVMVGSHGEVYVMDWGIARLTRVTGETHIPAVKLATGVFDRRHTRVGSVVGTPAYMSPEQARGEDTDERGDQFSLGLLLFELVTLCPAYDGDDPIRAMGLAQRGSVPELRHHGGAPISQTLAAVVRKATAPDPDHRYPGVAELGADVRLWLLGEPTLARPDRGLRRVTRWMARHQVASLGALFGALLIAAFAVITGLVDNALDQAQAQQDVERLGRLLTTVGGAAHRVDAQLLEYEGLVRVLAAGSVEVLSRPKRHIGPEGYAYFVGEGFHPPDLASSDRYGRDVSIGFPVLQVAKGRTLEEVELRVLQLTLLRQPLQRLLLDSVGQEAVVIGSPRAKQVLLDEGTPLAYAYVVLEDGVTAQYPGHGGLPPGYDPRRLTWYEATREGAPGPHWGIGHVDVAGLGLVLPCTMALYDDDGLFLGVVGTDVALDDLIDRLLVPHALDGVSEVYLVNRDGAVVVSSADKGRMVGRTATNRRRRLKRFPVEAVVPALVAGTAGHLTVPAEDGADEVIVHVPMTSLGWSYVVRIAGDAVQ
jgi:eukaryotic-like serine/threonine-protein kinase